MTGNWSGTFTLNAGPPAALNLNLVQATGSDDITGKLSTSVLTGPDKNGSTLTLTGVFISTTYKGTFAQDQFLGTFSFTKNQ